MNVLAASEGANAAIGGLLWLVLSVVGMAAYWAPSLIAFARHTPGKAQVVVVNLLLGWTVIGWIVALVMSFRDRPKAVRV
jgi:hypothetical protein